MTATTRAAIFARDGRAALATCSDERLPFRSAAVIGASKGNASSTQRLFGSAEMLASETVVASEASEPLPSTSAATPKVDPPRSAATPSRTPAAGSRRLVFSTPISTPSAPASSMRKNPRTPASGYKMGNEEMCAVCFSPLERDRDRRRDFFAEALSTDADASAASAAGDRGEPRDGVSAVETPNVERRRENERDDPKRVLFTTDCNHVFHRCCLVKCREQDFSTCPMCRAALPSGLTPEHVREKNAARRLADQANAQQRSIVGAAQRAREAVRAQYVRRMVNRPLGQQTGAHVNVPSVIEEEGEGGGSPLGEMPPWMSPPRGRPRGGSAPATPARTVSSPAELRGRARDEQSAHGRRDRNLSPFVTAAEELRARADASAAVSAAFATASAPSTPARTRSGEHATGTVSSLVANATRGPGNAGTLDGIAAAEEDRTRRSTLDDESRIFDSRTVTSLAAALGAALGDVSVSADRDGTGTGIGTRRDPLVFREERDDNDAVQFRSAAEELRLAGARSASARDALVAHGTASAPATPMAHRPAVAAAMAAAEAAAAEGDERGGERARRVMRRLAAE